MWRMRGNDLASHTRTVATRLTQIGYDVRVFGALGMWCSGLDKINQQ